MPIEPHRIEATARALHDAFSQKPGDWDSKPERVWAHWTDEAKRLAAVLFPELAAGTAWVAPVTLTPELAQVLDDLTWGEFMEAARDAHLSKGKDDDHG
jgi:hypothetical protein